MLVYIDTNQLNLDDPRLLKFNPKVFANTKHPTLSKSGFIELNSLEELVEFSQIAKDVHNVKYGDSFRLILNYYTLLHIKTSIRLDYVDPAEILKLLDQCAFTLFVYDDYIE